MKIIVRLEADTRQEAVVLLKDVEYEIGKGNDSCVLGARKEGTFTYDVFYTDTYKCKCGAEFDEMDMGRHHQEHEVCPFCGGEPLEKV